MSKIKELQKSIVAMSTETLKTKATEEAIRLRKMKFSHTVTPLESSASIKALRRDIARMQTELTKRSNNA